MFRRFHTKQKLFVFIGLFLLIVAAHLGIIWWENTYSEKILEVSSNARKIALDEARLKEIARLVDETERDRVRANAYLIPKDGVVAFIEYIETLGVNTGLSATVSGVASVPLGKKGNDPTEELRLAVSGTGSFQNAFRFISALETLPYKVRIERAVLERAGGDEKDPVWQAEATLFVRKEK